MPRPPSHTREPDLGLLTIGIACSQVLICNGANATGNCDYSVYNISTVENRTCYDMPTGYYENAATFAPDGEPFYCYPRV